MAKQDQIVKKAQQIGVENVVPCFIAQMTNDEQLRRKDDDECSRGFIFDGIAEINCYFGFLISQR
jgi:hypothetical protein